MKRTKQRGGAQRMDASNSLSNGDCPLGRGCNEFGAALTEGGVCRFAQWNPMQRELYRRIQQIDQEIARLKGQRDVLGKELSIQSQQPTRRNTRPVGENRL